MTKDELLVAMKVGKMAYNHVWHFTMTEDGKIFGGCDDPGCCDLEYGTFDEMYNEYKVKDWRV